MALERNEEVFFHNNNNDMVVNSNGGGGGRVSKFKFSAQFAMRSGSKIAIKKQQGRKKKEIPNPCFSSLFAFNCRQKKSVCEEFCCFSPKNIFFLNLVR
jgi:hypothetical protein